MFNFSAPVVLASQSPQRKGILESLGVPFVVHPSSVDEESEKESDPKKRAMHLAHLKAQDVAKHHPNNIVIGCDTLVVASNGALLEKPIDEADARRMLRLQSNTTSAVHSGLCVIHPKQEPLIDCSSSSVTFEKLTEETIDWWISTGLWKDRSGSFQIDGLGQLMISHIEGDFTSIVGLPVYLLGRLLSGTGRG